MYNVLIIDDEEPLREAIRILGDWQGLGVGQVLEATDGRAGLAMLAEHAIDVALIDMKMPELDGMELLRIIEQRYPDLLTIVISGYNDFQYTRQAILSKVVDYLLKPINRTDLNQALRQAIDVIEAKRKLESESIHTNITLNMSLPKLKEKIYLSIIERSFKTQMNEAMLPLIGATDAANRFSTVVLRVLNLDQISVSKFNGDVDLLHFAIANVINEIAGDSVTCFSFANPKREREMIAVVTLKGGYREDMIYRSLYQIKKAAATLEQLFGILIVAGIGELCDDVMDIAGSYDSARAYIHAADLLKLAGTTVTNGSDRVYDRDNYSWAGRMPTIRAALESGNVQNAKSVIADFSRKWRAAEGFSIGNADWTLHEFVILLNDIALELKVTPEQLPMSGDQGLRALGISVDFANFAQFEELLHRILDHVGNQIRKSLSLNRTLEVGDIKTYIDRHYYEDIKISMFTDKYFLSREYIMKLFKQQFGFGIHEYVQKVRMDKAKQLLDDPALKIQDISEMLGFKDKNYFSKAFRNYYSVSPTEYRDDPRRDKK